MTPGRFNVTFDVVTPESAEHGDVSDLGFLDSRGNRSSVAGVCGQPAGALKASCAMRLRDALALVSPGEDSGRWFSEVDGRQNYKTGEEERRALHPPEHITSASYGRLARLIGVHP